MILHYLNSARRYLSRNRLYAAINVMGLATSLAACVLILAYVQGELSYDRHWLDADRLYRANFKTMRSGRPPQPYPISSELMLPALKQYFPSDIELGARIYRVGPDQVLIGDVRYPDPVLFVDEDLIAMFQFDTLYGDIESAFSDLNSIALDVESARRYFGAADAVGQTLTAVLDNGELENYNVVAVYELHAGNSVLEIPNIARYDQDKVARVNNFFESWLRLSVQTFVKLSAGADPESVLSGMPDLLDLNASLPPSRLEAGQTPSDVLAIELQQVGDIYLNPIPFINVDLDSGNRSTVLGFLVVSILVVLIGCVNFILLATALAERRRLEVAIRKVHGARPEQLLLQYLGESLLLSLAAFAIALLAVVLVMPLFEGLMNKDLPWSFATRNNWIMLGILLTAVGCLGCLYPAFLLSRQAPQQALGASTSRRGGGIVNLRSLLVVLQFAISIVLIIGTISIYGQLYFTQQQHPGYNPERLLVIQGFGQEETEAYKQSFKQEALSLADVTAGAFSANGPNNGLGLILDYQSDVAGPSSQALAISTLFIGFDFFQTYQIPLLAGRYPERGRDAEEDLLFIRAVAGDDTSELNSPPATVLLSASAARLLGFLSPAEAINQLIEFGQPGESGHQEFAIIGVVEDTQYRSLRSAPAAEIYYLQENGSDVLTLRFEGDPQEALSAVTRVWEEVVGDSTMTASFVEEVLAESFRQERNEGMILVAFSTLALVVACLGLYGIAAFSVQRRVRETSLRKVLGAETHHIVGLLLWQFSLPVLLANLLAWPLGVWAVLQWMERFPYQFDRWLLLPICLVAAALTLLIAWSTVIARTHSVARRNPALALRQE